MAASRRRRKRGAGHGEDVEMDERWLLTYSDMITLLMALFIILWAMATVNTSKFEALSRSLKDAFSGRILPGGSAVMHPGASAENAQAEPPPPVAEVEPVDERRAMGDATQRENEELSELKRKIDRWTREHGLANEVQTRIARRGLVVRVLTDKILFDSGSAALKPESDELLDAMSKLLKTEVRNPIQVEGNTDNVPVSGRYATNWELSTARASTVVRSLIKRGIWAGRLSAAGYAAQHPVASNATPSGRQRNRRVELVVLRRYAYGQGGQVTQGGPGS